jgi:hypothetical protein
MESKKEIDKKIVKLQRKKKLFFRNFGKNDDAKQGGNVQENIEVARK